MSSHRISDHDDSSTSDSLDLGKEDGWEDVEADEVEEIFISLFDEKGFTKLHDMLLYCRDQYAFDIWQLQQQHNLDFLGLVRLVNYVRLQVRQGDKSPNVTSKSAFDDETYLLPVLDDDAVLYSLEDVLQNGPTSSSTELGDLKEQLASLQSQFAAYKDDVQKYLNDRLQISPDDDAATSNLSVIKEEAAAASSSSGRAELDQSYFNSYSYNSIHESMLKDTVRTDAYRDFIYENKEIFRGKVVLDVGCGTGILSMFCAKAGARLVIAVDNSDIVNKAKQNIAVNGLQDKIQCIRGKIEEVTLPVDKVDIIVSEWMGYCLLYESMLDSVIHARDKYLAPDGLMAPSHVTIQMAPLSDSDLRVSYIDFWRDVYGFNMTAMLEKAEEEVLIRDINANELAADNTTVLSLDLHTATVRDLDFSSTFRFNAKPNFDVLEGFVIWFDTYFMSKRSTDFPSSTLTVEKAKQSGNVAFSTGPTTRSTHWQQGICLIKDPADTKLSAGETIEGTVKFQKLVTSHRALNIEIKWSTGGQDGKSQLWYLE